jgi:scyllo-inositol 2-dehydrogenase (NADP+)
LTADVRSQRTGATVDDYFEIGLDYGDVNVILKAGMLVREQGPHFSVHGTEGSFVKYGMDPQEASLRRGLTPSEPDWGLEPQAQWGTLNTQMGRLHFYGQVETMPGCYQAFYENVYQAIAQGTELAVNPTKREILFASLNWRVRAIRNGVRSCIKTLTMYQDCNEVQTPL